MGAEGGWVPGGDGVGGCAVAAWDEVWGAAVADDGGRWEGVVGGRAWAVADGDGVGGALGRGASGEGLRNGGRGWGEVCGRADGLEVEVEGRYLLAHRSRGSGSGGRAWRCGSTLVETVRGCGWGLRRTGVRRGAEWSRLWGSVPEGGGDSASGRWAVEGGYRSVEPFELGVTAGVEKGGGRDALVRRQVPGPDKLVAPGWWPVVTFSPARCRFGRGEWRPESNIPRVVRAMPGPRRRVRSPATPGPSPARSRPGNRGRSPRPRVAHRASPARCRGLPR